MSQVPTQGESHLGHQIWPTTGGVVYKRLHIFACDRLCAAFCPYTSKFFVQPLMCVQNGKKSLKSSKIAKIVKNRKKWSKIAKIVKNRQKIAINRQKSLIIVEISNRNVMLKAGPATLGTQAPDFQHYRIRKLTIFN